MPTPRALVAVVLALVVLAGACADDDSTDSAPEVSQDAAGGAAGDPEPDLREQLIGFFVEGGSIERADAECAVDYLFDELDQTELELLATVEGREEVTDEQLEIVTRSVAACLTPAETDE